MKVNYIDINNFRGISNLRMEFQEHINILIGVNGVGKSSILDVLAIMLSRFICRICSTRGTGRLFSNNDIRYGTSLLRSAISITYQETPLNWAVSKSRTKVSDSVPPQKIGNLTEIKEIANAVISSLEENPQASVPIAVFYPVNRSVIEIPLRVKKKHIFNQISAYDLALTGGRNDFRLFFEWFRNREDLENETIREDRNYIDHQMKAVRKVIEDFVGLSELRVRRSPLRMEAKKNEKFLNIGNYSDGEKCFLALVGDLARRLAVANPLYDNPLEGSGVVLIDEIDLHLHPQWQRMVIPKLKSVFPNCQFIVSTHSPQIISEAEASEIFALKEDNETKEIEFYKPSSSLGLSSNEILDFIMETAIRNTSIEEDLTGIYQHINNDNYELARYALDKLRKKINSDIPEFHKIETMIRFLEFNNEE